METKIQKWGNSFGVRLPMEVITKQGLGNGSPVEVTANKGRIIIHYLFHKKENLKDLVNKITPENLHREAEWGDACGKEIW